MKINTKLTIKGCWKMVNRIQEGETPSDIRRRCDIAGEWLKANEIISNDEYDDLMRTVTYLYRESYRFN